MITSLPPGWILMLGALALPLLPRLLKQVWMLLLPLLGLWQLTRLEHGFSHATTFLDLSITLVHVDQLAMVWGIIFHLAAFLAVIYALHVRDDVQHVAGLVYAGSAVAAVFAGDLLALFCYWELTAISSVFLIWARRSERSFRCGLRYLVLQVGSGVLLLSGVLVRYHETGSLAFGHMSLDDGLGAQLVFLSFGIKAAFPLLHTWLPDAYPEGTATGTVFLSTFTTKLAIFALARCFAGTEELIWIGLAMAVFPLLFALVVDDLRRALAYALNNQLGFMVVGVGIGSELALAGVAAHAFCHILYKSLLFMSLGAVLQQAGTACASGLGGLRRAMPWTAALCCVGALGMSAPGFCSFASKSLIISAAAEEHLQVVYFVLVAAATGVFFAAGLRVPYLTFFRAPAEERKVAVREAPWNMRVAMLATAALVVAIGVHPAGLYALLPSPPDYQAYTVTHVVTQLQLLAFAGLAFAVLTATRLLPAPKAAAHLDFDWVYRRLAPALGLPLLRVLVGAWNGALAGLRAAARPLLERGFRHHGSTGLLARTWPTGSMALWVAVLLGAALILYYL